MTETQTLVEWYRRFIDYFRDEYSKLSTDDKLGISNTNNYLNPCQIEVFWVKKPSSQLIVISNFEERSDKEVIVNGPFITDQFFENVQLILRHPQWQKKLTTDPNFLESHDRETYGEELAGVLHNFIEVFKSTVMGEFRQLEGYGVGQALFNKCWVWSYNGNISDKDYRKEIDFIIAGIKSEAKRKREEEKPVIQTKILQLDMTDGYGVHFFPPTIIGDRVRLTIEQILHGNMYDSSAREKVYSVITSGNKIIFYKNGFVFIETKQQVQALRLLNLIMAIGVLHDLSVYTVREHELSKCTYDKKTEVVTSMQWGSQSMRAFLFMEHSQTRFGGPHHKTKVSLDKIKEIMSDVEKIVKIEKLVEELRLFIESYTHFQNSEHAQSFIMSWSVIERYYSDIWRRKLDEKDLDHERAGKLSNPSQWSIDYIIEVLNLSGDIDDTEYDLLMELKSKRNRFYHKGKQVSKEDSEKGLKIIRSILTKKISLYSSV